MKSPWARPVRHSPERLDEATEEGFFGRFLAQLAVPNAQVVTAGDAMHVTDVTSGSAATLAPDDGGWRVQQAGPLRLWDAVKAVWEAWRQADRPGPESFRMRIHNGRQRIHHHSAANLSFTLPA
ncbi:MULTISPECIES: hypothetical protein [unclassified Spirillospora]|uniref:hypothetical protein n=1 Tax=unclassified Spirillospora TaxID=2642701 RepID=UPI00371EFE31